MKRPSRHCQYCSAGHFCLAWASSCVLFVIVFVAYLRPKQFLWAKKFTMNENSATTRHLGANTGYTSNIIHLTSSKHTLLFYFLLPGERTNTATVFYLWAFIQYIQTTQAIPPLHYSLSGAVKLYLLPVRRLGSSGV